MLISFNYTNKADIRKIGELIWSVQSGFEQEIQDPDMLENLLTYPGDQFSIAPTDPVLLLIGEDQAADLGVSGVTNLETLATLTGDEIEILSNVSGYDQQEINSWVKMAQDALTP